MTGAREVSTIQLQDPPMVLTGTARGYPGDRPRPAAPCAASPITPDRTPVLRRADEPGGDRPALPEPRSPLRRDRRRACLAAAGRVTPDAAGLRGGGGEGRRDPSGSPGPAWQATHPGRGGAGQKR